MFRQFLVDLLSDLEQTLSELSLDQLLRVLVNGQGSSVVGAKFLGRSLTLRSAASSDWSAAWSNSTDLLLQELVVGSYVPCVSKENFSLQI